MPNDQNGRLRPPSEATSYDVGYGKPPVGSRFAPGQSGNPKGRPRGSLNKPLGPDRLKEIILAEAYRSIKVNEGKRQISVPMVTAVMRALAVNAARGQLRSQQLFTKMLSETEQARAVQIERLFDAAAKYKVEWEDELDRRERLGITGPEPIPHPDDIQVNFVTAEVRFTGPMTRREKAARDYLYDRVEEADRKIESLTVPLEKSRSKIVRDIAEAKIAYEQRIREEIVSKIGEPSKRRRS
jgi:Family of unknown function (DUF5681)